MTLSHTLATIKILASIYTFESLYYRMFMSVLLIPALFVCTHTHTPLYSNCLFRALSIQVGDRLTNHASLRRDVVHYMREHREEFEPFLENQISFDQYRETIDVVTYRVQNNSLTQYIFRMSSIDRTSTVIV